MDEEEIAHCTAYEYLISFSPTSAAEGAPLKSQEVLSQPQPPSSSQLRSRPQKEHESKDRSSLIEGGEAVMTKNKERTSTHERVERNFTVPSSGPVFKGKDGQRRKERMIARPRR